jgi:hypothetical protein
VGGLSTARNRGLETAPTTYAIGSVVNEDHAQPQPVRLKLARPLEVADLRLALSRGVQRELACTLLPGEGRVLRLTEPWGPHRLPAHPEGSEPLGPLGVRPAGPQNWSA